MKERLHGLFAGLFLPAMLLVAGCSGPASESTTNDPRAAAENAQPSEPVQEVETKSEPVEAPVSARPAPKPAPAPAPVAKKAEPKAVARVADSQPPAPVVPEPVVEPPRPVVEPPRPEPRPVAEAPRPVEQPRPPVYVPTPVTPAPAVVPDRPAPPPAPVNRQVTIPSGTLIPVRMIDSVDSKTDKIGQTFLATIDEPVVVNGEVVIARNSDVYVKLVQAKTSGQLTGRSELQLALERITVAKRSYDVESNVFQTQGASQTTTTARNTGIGAGVGALIGALAGGKKGAAIGAGVGGGAGVAAAVMAKGDQVRVPAESKLTFRLENSVEVTLVGAPVAPSASPANPPIGNPTGRRP